MPRCRFVQPKVVRLHLHEGAESLHEALIARLKDAAKDRAFTDAETEQIAVSRVRIEEARDDGFWIDIKNKLNAGEGRHIFGRMVKSMAAGEKTELDPEEVGVARVVEYLVGWNLTNIAGEPEPYSEDALLNVDQDTFGEILACIDLHEERLAKERAALKKTANTVTESPAI